MGKQQLLDDLYYLMYMTENESVFTLIGDAINFLKEEITNAV